MDKTNEQTKKVTVWRVKILTTTWLSYAGFYFCRKNFFIGKDAIGKAFEIDDLALAQIFTAYLTAYMLGQFLSAYLGRRFAARLLLLGGMGLTLICNLIFGVTVFMGPAGFYPMMLFMVLNGFAQATGWPGNVGVLGNWLSSEERGRIMGVWATCYQIGSVMAKWFAAFMLAWLGLAWSFWGAAIVMFGIWLLFFFFEADRPEDVGLESLVEEVEVEVEDTGAAEDETEAGQGMFSGWTREVVASIFFIGIVYFVFKFCRYALDSWAPLMINRSFPETVTVSGLMAIPLDLFGLSRDLSIKLVAGIISGTSDWIGFLGVIFAGYATDKFFGGRRHQIILIMSVGMFFAIIFTTYVGFSSLMMASVSLALIMFMLMGPDSLLSGVGAIDVGGKRGAVAAAGIINGLGSVGPIIQEQVIGWASSRYGFQSIFYLLLAVAFFGVLGTAYLSIRSRQGRSNL